LLINSWDYKTFLLIAELRRGSPETNVPDRATATVVVETDPGTGNAIRNAAGARAVNVTASETGSEAEAATVRAARAMTRRRGRGNIIW